MPDTVQFSEVDSEQESTLRTFLIADIRGYTRFTQEHGDEEGARLAAEFAAVVREGVADRHGEVVELRGDEALVVFSSARQALRAAVDLQKRLSRAASESSLPLNVGVGVDAGEAVPFEGGYRGGALNLAARLCALAGPGEILVSETLVGLARKVEGLEYSERGYLELKGFGEPVRVLQVIEKLAAPEGKGSHGKSATDRDGSEIEPERPQEQQLPVGGFVGSLPSSALVARQTELKKISEIVSQVERGVGHLVLLSGEPGAGKTRLAQEVTVKLHNRGFLLGSGSCYEARHSTPFYPFLEALAQLYGACPLRIRKEVPRKWPPLARLLPDQNFPTAYSMPGIQDQERLFWAISGFVQAIAESAPVAILLDDLHWADESSLELMQHLARHSRPHKILLVGTYRDVDLARNRFLGAALRDLTRQELLDRISVGRLNEEETASFVAEILEQPQLPHEFVHLLYRHTEGNPFFIQQVLHVLIDRGDVRTENGGWAFQNVPVVDVPETVRSVIGQRLAYLSETTQDVLRRASVLGQHFSFRDVHAITERTEAELDEAIEEARAAGVVRTTEEDSFAFDHALTQQVLYSDLSPRRKRRLHLSIGQALEKLPKPAADNRASEIAWHFLRGTERERALTHVLRAGDQALGVFANRQAEDHYRTAVDIAGEVENHDVEAQALEKLGQVLRTQSRYPEALAEFETAARLAQTSNAQEDEMRLMAQIGLTHAERGTTKEGIERLERFLTSASSSHHTQSLAALYSALSRLYYFDSRPQESLDVADLASALSSSLGDESLLAQADVRRGAALYLLGRIEEALRTLEGAMGLAERQGDRENVCRALHNISSCYMIRGDLEKSKRYREQMLRVAEQIGDTGQIIFAKSYLGLIFSYMGRWDDAMESLQAASDMGNKVGSSWYASYGRILLGYLDFLRDPDAKLKIDPGVEGDTHERDTFSQALRGEQEILAGQPDKTMDRLEPLRFKDDLGSPLLLATLAWAQLQAGHKEAERTAMVSVAQAKRYKQAQHFVDALRVRAMVFRQNGTRDKAERDLRVAVSLAKSIPYVLAEARALLEWGGILKENGDLQEANGRLREAFQLFQKLGAKFYMRIAEDALSEGVEN